MKRIINYFIVFIISCFCFVNVFAARFNNETAEETVEEFITCLNNGDECALNYIVKTNEDLVAGVRENLRAVEIHYYIKDVKKVDDYYVVKMTINAEGPGWSVSGFTVKYNVENVNGSALITETTLFDSIGTEAVGKLVLKIFAIIGTVLLGIFGMIIATVIIVIVVVKKKNKKGV